MSIRDWILGDGRVEILRVAHRHGVERIALFGSVARGDDSEDSDCDFMVDFSGLASLVDLAVLKYGLEELLGRDVDVVPTDGLREKHLSAAEDAIVL